jgi:5-methylcytosine-specific restriction endonuclease McrA
MEEPEMKKVLMAVSLLFIGWAFAQTTYSPARIIKSWSWDGYDHVVFESDGHQYLEVRSRTSAGVSVIHYESCPCKATPTVKNPQPRYFSKEMRMRKYSEQAGICPHCKKHFEFNEMHGDHIVPYSKGGTTTFDNLQMLCAPCNLKKGNRYSY